MAEPSNTPEALQAMAPLVAQTLRQRGLGHLLLLARLIQHWPAIAGPQLAAVTQPDSIRGRVLFITVCDAIWLQQVTFYQAQLLENIRSVLGDVSMSRLHFTLALSSRQPASPAPAAFPEAETHTAPVALTAEEAQQLQEATAHIADPELREAIRRAWQRGWQARRQ